MNRIPSPLTGKISQEQIDRGILGGRCLIAPQEEITRAEHGQNILWNVRINPCPFSQLTRKRAEILPRRNYLTLVPGAQKQSRCSQQDRDRGKPEISTHS